MEGMFDEEEEDWGSPITHMIAGAVAGTSEHCLMFPVDTVKTYMQAGTFKPLLTPLQALRNGQLPIVQAVKSIHAKRGTAGFFRGLTAMVAGAAPAHAVYFWSYELFKGHFGGKKDDGVHRPLAYFSAGVVATVFSDAVFTPMDAVKQKMQLGARSYKSFRDCIVRTYKEAGIWRGFYAGYTTTLVMNVPYSGTYFATYEFIKHILLKDSDVDHSPLENCIAGGIAGVISAAITNPLDVARTRLQTQLDIHGGERKYKNMHQTVSLLWKEEGVAAMTAGMGPRMLFHSTAAAICWGVYEYMKFLLS